PRTWPDTRRGALLLPGHGQCLHRPVLPGTGPLGALPATDCQRLRAAGAAVVPVVDRPGHLLRHRLPADADQPYRHAAIQRRRRWR
nr:hypothetical protein [Tanacetum cinerariifolium]